LIPPSFIVVIFIGPGIGPSLGTYVPTSLPSSIEIRWCPANKRIAGNEKADEWAKIAAEEPDTRGVKWLSYSDRVEVRTIPLPSVTAQV